MVSTSDFTQTCNATILSEQCTPETCCLMQGEIQYLPSLGGNIAYAGLFAALMIPNLFFGIRYRTWSFFSWMMLGLLGEIAGYVGRIMLNINIFSFNAFLTYLIPLTIAPAFITASIYLCLARIIYILDPNLRHTRLKPMTYTKIFVTFDLLALILQGAGGGLAATANDKKGSDLGVNVMIAGLAFQVFSILIFTGLCADFAWRLRKSRVSRKARVAVAGRDTSYGSGALNRFPENHGAVGYKAIEESFAFKGMIIAMAAAVLLIFVRSTYRLAELQAGFDGALANNEVLFMIFEGPMIILACAGLAVFHPGVGLDGVWSMKDLAIHANDEAEKNLMTSATNSRAGVNDMAMEEGYAMRRTGSGEAFRITSGTPKVASFVQEIGLVMHHSFCGDCGSTIYKETIAGPAQPFILVQAGTIDGEDLEQVVPDVELWTSRRARWLPALTGVEQKARFD
ncbi:RTA1 like protein-domain-containing protein [Xylariales sp. AK1849]|nr:RTA1 like protein-domain-containing protein [Xylariales sp. AK1849]